MFILIFSFNGGKGGLVVKVQNAGVAAEDVSFLCQVYISCLQKANFFQDKVQIGDVVTEINGHEITSATRTKLNSIMRQAAGSPVQLSILRVSVSLLLKIKKYNNL